MTNLLPLEVDVLRMMNGEGPPLIWGAALASALEALVAMGLAHKSRDHNVIRYEISEKGKAVLNEQKV